MPRSVANAVTVTGSATVDGDLDLALGAVDGAGELTKQGAGTLSFGGPGTLRGFTLTSGALAVDTLTITDGGTFFQRAGTTFTGTLVSTGLFVHAGGTFAGRLVNGGTMDFGVPTFTAGDGIANYGTLAATAGLTFTLDGSGLDNQGTIELTGGRLAGAGPMTNDAMVSGFGTVGGSGGFTNNAQLTVSGGNLTLANTGGNANAGNVTLAVGRQLRLTGGTLTNTGTVDLAGGTVAGTAALVNDAGGTVVGRGLISAPFANAGGTLRAVGGTINVTNAFDNAGVIRLEAGAGLAGGAIANAGRIQGDGTIANPIDNTGRIEPIGTLVLGGPVTNTGAGLIAATAGNAVVITAGLATSEAPAAHSITTAARSTTPARSPGSARSRPAA